MQNKMFEQKAEKSSRSVYYIEYRTYLTRILKMLHNIPRFVMVSLKYLFETELSNI